MTEPAYLFTDPHWNRNNEILGRPGIVSPWGDGLPEGLLSLNAIHEAHLVPQADLSPLAKALRDATPAQVENARHLVIHALDRVRSALWDRRFSLDPEYRERRCVLPRQARESLPKVVEAGTPAEAIRAVSEEVRVSAGPALDLLAKSPTNEMRQRQVAELAGAFLDASALVNLVAASTGDREMADYGLRLHEEEAAFSERLQAFRDGVGPVYADAVRSVIPDRAAMAMQSAARVGALDDMPRLSERRLKALIDAMGGYEDGIRAHFGRRMALRAGMADDFYHPEPDPLTEEQALRFAREAADVLDAYQGLHHRPGFGGYLMQAANVLENMVGSPGREVIGIGMRRLVETAVPGKSYGREMTFRPHPDVKGLLVGRFPEGDRDDHVGLIYTRETGTNVKGAVLLAFVPADAYDADGAPSVEAINGRTADVAFATHFHGVGGAFEWLGDAEERRRYMPSGIEMDGAAYEATRTRAASRPRSCAEAASAPDHVGGLAGARVHHDAHVVAAAVAAADDPAGAAALDVVDVEQPLAPGGADGVAAVDAEIVEAPVTGAVARTGPVVGPIDRALAVDVPLGGAVPAGTLGVVSPVALRERGEGDGGGDGGHGRGGEGLAHGSRVSAAPTARP